MAASVFTSELYHRLFPVGEIGRLFTDSAEIRALLLVEGALAKVQGQMGLIPEISGAYIHRSSMETQIDPGNLAVATGTNGVAVPGLVAAFRKEMQAPEHAQYAHWGATSQDISDTGQMLRLRQYLNHIDTGLTQLLRALGTLAQTHADLVMPGRTYGQHATPTTFGTTVARWGAPLLDLKNTLETLRSQVLWVSLSGASGTGAAFGQRAAELRAALAEALGLRDPGRTWHTDRSPILILAAWLSQLAAGLGKMAEDLILLTQTGIGEVTLGASGSSSTMPQKQNPVQPSAIVALSRHTIGLNATLQGAALHRQDRDGAAWFTEWLCLPPLCLSTAAALSQATSLASALQPNSASIAQNLAQDQGLLQAEALSFHLAQSLPRPAAQTAVKSLCTQSAKTGASLSDLARTAYPEMNFDGVFDPTHHTGNAPQEARDFAQACQSL